ncbi:MAG: polysaccharide biosynthesis/export family protein [Bacteroidetes bacterium]|uniref:polysaccharide biosynthesis/export family protein n=1 Tax=Phnomibacter sp. TaxID=2836217 RepID=UPI002FDEED27|nr:polysaccharide biosynthesis/export family protein [Bacteroidota bacterium]
MSNRLITTICRQRSTVFLLFLTLAMAACRPSKEAVVDYRFFEKNIDSLNKVVLNLKEPVIQKNDQLVINVSSASLDQTQTQVFNLLGGSTGGGGASQAGAIGYLVDYDGNITLPVIGKVQAAGLTKSQLIQQLEQKLSPYVKDPVLNIRFINFRVMMMGEVGGQGWLSFPNERATIVDAIGQAGITEQGMRTNILLIRQQPNGQVETHRIDLNDALIFQSPYYQLQQNDILYVLPNDSKLIQYQRSNSPFFRDLPVYLGLVTSIMAFGTLIISLTR